MIVIRDLLLLVIAAAAWVFAISYQDVMRYLRMRSM